jgi:hypothetical protein
MENCAPGCVKKLPYKHAEHCWKNTVKKLCTGVELLVIIIGQVQLDSKICTGKSAGKKVQT